MMTIYTDRSRIISYQRCPRLRFHNYHDGSDRIGIESSKKPLPLCVGGAVHVGLEVLLRKGQQSRSAIPDGAESWGLGGAIEEHAVAAALADFATHRGALELDLSERPPASLPTPLASVVPIYAHQLRAQAADLGMDLDDPQFAALTERVQSSARDFDDYLYAEQSALVEGMVRAYARRRLRPLLEEYEVLEVEREGDWVLSNWSSKEHDEEGVLGLGPVDSIPWGTEYELRFMSRPDALLRSRADNSLYLLSFKTAASWDIRKAKDAEHDMQGLSEGVEVEKRLADWWQRIQNGDAEIPGPDTIVRYLLNLPAPPRILGIRYEFLLKGERWKDKDLSARYGFDARVQRSPLVRGYLNSKTGEWNASWDFCKEDGASSKLAWQSWKSRPIWTESGGVRAWIDKLDSATETMSAYDSTTGMEPRPLGWKSEAQVTGYLPQHPLDEVFIPPIVVYRNDDELRDWVEQVEAQERRVAEGVTLVHAAGDEDERRHQLNVQFPMNRQACQFPSECAMTKICFSGEDMKRDPVGSGLFKIRIPHHVPEKEHLDKKKLSTAELS